MSGVIIRARHVIKPAAQTWNGILCLSELDQIGEITLVPNLYIYNSPNNQEWDNKRIVDTLRESLSRALVHFYPLAGRLRWVGDGGRLELECNAKGAVLIEAECLTKKLNDFSGDFYSSYCDPIFQDLMPCFDYDGKSIHQNPTLAVQVTQFACGGISIGIEISHAVVDGRSSFQFIQQWARLARGENVLEQTPSFDRSVLQDRDHTKVDGSVFSERWAVKEAYHDQEDMKAKNVNHLVKVPTIVTLTKHQIGRLLQVANDGQNEAMLRGPRRPYSRFEVVAAHTWRSACRARGGDPDQTTMAMLLVDCRRRLNPPLPISSYFGNAIVEVPVHFRIGELLSMPLRYVCQKVREAIDITNNEYVLSFVEFFQNEESISKYQFINSHGNLDGASYGSNGLTITSWMGLGFYGIDFGWGKEISFGHPFGHAPDGETIILSHHTIDGAMVVVMWLHPKDKFIKYMYEDVETKFTSNLVSQTVALSKKFARL